MELRNESDIRWLIEKVAEKLNVNGSKYTVWNPVIEEEHGVDGDIDEAIKAIKEVKEGSICFERDNRDVGCIHFIVVNNFCFVKEFSPKVYEIVGELVEEQEKIE